MILQRCFGFSIYRHPCLRFTSIHRLSPGFGIMFFQTQLMTLNFMTAPRIFGGFDSPQRCLWGCKAICWVSLLYRDVQTTPGHHSALCSGVTCFNDTSSVAARPHLVRQRNCLEHKPFRQLGRDPTLPATGQSCWDFIAGTGKRAWTLSHVVRTVLCFLAFVIQEAVSCQHYVVCSSKFLLLWGNWQQTCHQSPLVKCFIQEVKRQWQVVCASAAQWEFQLVLETLMSHPKDHLESYSLSALSFKTTDGYASASPRSKQVQHDAASVVHTLSTACRARGRCSSYADCLHGGFFSLTFHILGKVWRTNCNERRVVAIRARRETPPVLIEQGLQ